MFIQTLGDLLDQQFALDAFCGPCARGFRVDLHDLAEKLGRDHCHLGVRLPISCAICGDDDLVTLICRA